jgi:hypothetical protein
MDNQILPDKEIDKQAEYSAELKKLQGIFAEVEEPKRILVDGLMKDAAYFYAENKVLRASLTKTGMIRVNPSNPAQQKPVEAARQYRQNSAAYAVIIKTLNGILSKNILDEDDDLEEFEDE